MSTQSHAGRVRIAEHVVELRSLRLSDGASWRKTNLDYEQRLQDAFHEPGVSWDEKHSTAAWAEQWWTGLIVAVVALWRTDYLHVLL
ncbi:hypothetical protein P1N98_07700, partial [Tsukamurella tyrosinosolvens]